MRIKIPRKKIRIGEELVTVQISPDGKLGKTCKSCKKFLEPNKFFVCKSSETARSLSTSCKECSSKITRHWRNKKRENILLHAAKSRSNREGIICDLKVEDIVLPKHCPIFGIELRHTYGPRSDESSSIDRIDNTKGYTKDNIVICSWRANRLKNAMSLEEIEKLYNFCKSYIEENKCELK